MLSSAAFPGAFNSEPGVEPVPMLDARIASIDLTQYVYLTGRGREGEGPEKREGVNILSAGS